MIVRTIFILIFIHTLAFAGVYHPAIEYIFPLPDSELLPDKTTVFLRLESDLHNQITDLDLFISVIQDGANKPGAVFFSTDGRTIIFKPTSDFRKGEQIDVIVRTSQVGHDDFNFSFSTWANTPNFQPPPPPLPPTLAKPNSARKTANGVREINGVAVPSDFPEIKTFVYGETAPGDIFWGTNFTQKGIGNYVIINNNQGTPLFYRRFENAGSSCANFVV